MSTSTYITSRRAVPVSIGTMQLYCEDMTIAAKRVNAETSTVSGSGTVTGSAPRCAVVNMKGRTFDESSPLHSAAQLDALLRSHSTLTVSYRGLVFDDCRILAYEVTDSGRDYVDLSVTLSSAGISEPEV